jgi:hypothetical protein
VKNFVICIIIIFLAVSCRSGAGKGDKNEDWIPLFNGKDLSGWDIKIKGSPLNENFRNTFRVEDGIMKVCYDKYEKFNGEYGHIFYKEPFSHYKLRIEYRFVGEQAPGGEAWAFRNSGVMLHSQSAASMKLDQDFPVSVEAQFLGGNGTDERHTLNVCTPGTHIMIDTALITTHCVNSLSKTYHGDVWVTAECEVYGDSIIHHIVDGKRVLTYSHPQVGGTNKPEDYPVPDGTPVRGGYICLQAESHPVEFRKVELLRLK